MKKADIGCFPRDDHWLVHSSKLTVSFQLHYELWQVCCCPLNNPPHVLLDASVEFTGCTSTCDHNKTTRDEWSTVKISRQRSYPIRASDLTNTVHCLSRSCEIHICILQMQQRKYNKAIKVMDKKINLSWNQFTARVRRGQWFVNSDVYLTLGLVLSLCGSLQCSK